MMGGRTMRHVQPSQRRRLAWMGCVPLLFLLRAHHQARVSAFVPALFNLPTYPKRQRLLLWISSSSFPEEALPPASLSDLLRDLSDFQVRFSPTATKRELQRLWQVHVGISNNENAKKKAPQQSQSNDLVVQNLLLSDLLQQLQDAGISFPTTASRNDLEQLWLQSQSNLPQEDDHAGNVVKSNAPNDLTNLASRSLSQETSGADGQDVMPQPSEREHGSDSLDDEPQEIPQVSLAAGIGDTKMEGGAGGTSHPYSGDDPPTKVVNAEIVDMEQHAARRQRRRSRNMAKQQYSPFDNDEERRRVNPSRHPRRPSPRMNSEEDEYHEDYNRPTMHSHRPRQRPPRSRSRPPSYTDALGRAGDATYRLARQSWQRAQDWWNVDDEGIRTVHAVPTASAQRRRPRSHTTTPREEQKGTASSERTYRVRPIVTPPPSSVSDTTNNSQTNQASLDPSFRPLPPSGWDPKHQFNDGETHRYQRRDDPLPRKRRRRRRPDRSNFDATKRIYSPYGAPPASSPPNNHRPQPKPPREEVDSSYFDDNNEVDEEYMREAVDQLGNMFSNAADYVMFGAYEEKQKRRRKESNSRTTSGRRPRPRPSEEQQQRHWKDKWEERVDSVLGIHEHGEFYNSWMDREADESQQYNNDDRYDAFAVAEGRPRPRPTRLQRRSVGSYGGFLTSFLFGGGGGGRGFRARSRPRKRQMQSNNPEDSTMPTFPPSNGGSLLSVIQVLGRVGNTLCQWASVRGAVPQPVVVLGVAVAGICTEQRIRAMLLALLAMRTAGELMANNAFLGYDDDEGYTDAQPGGADDTWAANKAPSEPSY